MVGQGNVSGASNKDAAAAADIIVLTVPHSAQRSTVEEVREMLVGKILVDATVPLVPPKVARVQLPAEGSAVAAIQRLLGADVRVVSAFQNVSAYHLKNFDHEVECDVLICGDDIAARETVVGLAADIGLVSTRAQSSIPSWPRRSLRFLSLSTCATKSREPVSGLLAYRTINFGES